MKKKKEKDLLQEEEQGVPEEARAEGDAKEDPRKKMEEDIALFHSLFPEVKVDQIPAEVWDRVEKGESLSAAFALYTVKNQQKEKRIRQVNEENEQKAPPRIRHDGGEEHYFSPEAVKAMSRNEIKKNYNAILASMEKWK